MNSPRRFPPITIVAALVWCVIGLKAIAQEGGPPPGAGLGMASMSGPVAAAAAPGAGGDNAVQRALESIGTTIPTDAIVQYDAETNSIIVVTDEETNSQISRVINSLDKPVPQVLIKVLFLEVTHTKDLDLGAEGSLTFLGGAHNESHTPSTDFGVAAASRGGFYKIVNDDFQATLRALAKTGKTEVLSRPAVLTRNNETATVTIGEEVPFIRNSRVTDSGQTINTVEYEDIGIILEVTPHITAERLVEMEVNPEISTLTADTVPISDTVNARVIAKRSAQTRVVVADGKTVIIGGLVEDKNTETVNKVPLLGDIPLLGALFRRTETSKSKTELLIFLTPCVVENSDALDKLTDQEQDINQMPPDVLKDPEGQRKYNVTPKH